MNPYENSMEGVLEQRNESKIPQQVVRGNEVVTDGDSAVKRNVV